MARYQYEIGTTANNRVRLYDLRVKPPLQTFRPYSRVVINGDGENVGEGWALDTWDWGFVDDEIARAALKTYCPNGLSSEVYIKTYNDFVSPPAWKVYRAKMLWMPSGEDRQNDHRIKFSIRFRLIEEIV